MNHLKFLQIENLLHNNRNIPYQILANQIRNLIIKQVKARNR
jgi:hypothetical protein